MAPPLKVSKLSSNLKKKGFKEEQKDHKVYLFYYDDKPTDIWTKISHGEGEIGQPLIIKMAKQLRLNKEEFIRFANCTISEDEYISILHERNQL